MKMVRPHRPPLQLLLARREQANDLCGAEWGLTSSSCSLVSAATARAQSSCAERRRRVEAKMQLSMCTQRQEKLATRQRIADRSCHLLACCIFNNFSAEASKKRAAPQLSSTRRQEES